MENDLQSYIEKVYIFDIRNTNAHQTVEICLDSYNVYIFLEHFFPLLL